MAYYFTYENGERKGPFTFDELKSERLLKSTLVWTEGMEKWAEAHTVEKLKNIVIAEPPPLDFEDHKSSTPKTKKPLAPKEKKAETNGAVAISNLKYDPTYKKESDATFIGIVLLIINNVIIYSDTTIVGPSVVFVSLILRIIITVWVVNIADRQNRNTSGWGVFAFVFPSFALIIIGRLKKKLKTVDPNEFSSDQELVKHCLNEANKYFNKDRLIDSLVYLNKAIQVENDNIKARGLRGKIYFHLKHLGKAAEDFDYLQDKEEGKDVANYYLGEIEFANKNRLKAIEYWLAVRKEGSFGESAQRSLDQYYTYTGNYFLNEKETKRKIGLKSQFHLMESSSISLKYVGGIPEFDHSDILDSPEVSMMIFTNGLNFIFNQPLKENLGQMALAYYEISNVTLIKKESKFGLNLRDGKNISFIFKKPYTNASFTDTELFEAMKEIAFLYKKATGEALYIQDGYPLNS